MSVSNGQLASKSTSVLKNLVTIPSTECMVVCENLKIYLIDLDNFSAGAITSTIVNIASGNY